MSQPPTPTPDSAPGPRRDSDDYLQKKRFFSQLLTVYGRKPVLEALQDPATRVYRLHLADSNKPGGIIDEIRTLALAKKAEIIQHDRQSLSRISRNSKQDQGVAVDLVCEGYQDYRDFLNNDLNADTASKADEALEIIALDRITNPQNLGMIIRSVCAAGSRALLLPEKGCARLDPLVIKASAGTLFRARILRCQDLASALSDFRQQGFHSYGLSSHAPHTLGELARNGRKIFVLGNETDGVSTAVAEQCEQLVSIPMHHGVESLNVAVTAALIAFRQQL